MFLVEEPLGTFELPRDPDQRAAVSAAPLLGPSFSQHCVTSEHLASVFTLSSGPPLAAETLQTASHTLSLPVQSVSKLEMLTTSKMAFTLEIRNFTEKIIRNQYSDFS